MARKRGSTREQNKAGAAQQVQCYLCGRTVAANYIVQRIEPRLATRYHGKPVNLCIYCAEEWDEEYPGTIPPKQPELPDVSAEAAEEQPAAEAPAAQPEPEEDWELPAARKVQEPIIDPHQPLTKRQRERLAWYENQKPIHGYDVRMAILRDDALGAVARKADSMGLSYGYLMVLKQKAEQQ